jgi:hypothetical protein
VIQQAWGRSSLKREKSLFRTSFQMGETGPACISSSGLPQVCGSKWSVWKSGTLLLEIPFLESAFVA